MIFSITEIQSYLRCRRLWHLTSSNRERIQRIVPGSAFSLGRGIHEALADWMVNPDSNPVASFALATAAMMAEAEEVYKRQTGMRISDAELAPITQGLELGTAMMRNYVAYWKTPLPGTRYKLIAPEQELVVPIWGTTHSLRVKLDGLIQNATGQLFIVEHKTYNQRPRDEALRYNFQFTGYTWAARTSQLGDVVGIAYDGMWKRPEPPRGREFSELFLRQLIRPGVDELHEFGVQLAQITNEMGDNPAIYKHWRSDGNCTYGCDMKELCVAMTRGEDTQYILKRFYSKRPEREDILVRVDGD